MPTGSTITLRTPLGFDFVTTVTTYGYYMLAPNVWHKDTQRLDTVLRDANGNPVHAMLAATKDAVKVRCDRAMSAADRHTIRTQAQRILRLDEPPERFTQWHTLCPDAAQRKFGRLIRSATLFEDIVKTMTGCNVAWSQTIRMNQLLCEHFGGGAFPLPAQLADVPPEALKEICRVGYRAERIVRLAKAVRSGDLDLAWYELPDHDTPSLHKSLCKIYGLGDYAAGNLCQHLGRYDRMAIDSETYRHFREVHGMKTPTDSAKLRRLHARIHRHYDHYAPFQFLAYWFELWFRTKLPD